MEINIKQHKILLPVVAVIALGLLLFLTERLTGRQQVKTQSIPTTRTELVETAPQPFLEELPFDGGTFYIDYPEFDIYTVSVKTSNITQAKKEVYEWFTSRGANLSELKIRFITKSDEEIIERIIRELPVDTTQYKIRVSPKANSFVVTVRGSSFKEGEQLAKQWFEEHGLTDLTSINLLWEDETK